MRIIQRAEWGARHDSAYKGYNAPLPATETWLHHSVTIAPDLVPPFTDDYAAIRTLEQIGEDRFGYGISYTWLITPAGLIFEGHRVDGVGTHTGGRNSRARAICLVGNYEDAEPTDEQITAAAWLLQHAHQRGWIDRPALDGGHRDLKATACPGIKAYRRIDDINRLAAGPPITEEDDMPTADEIAKAVWNRENPDTGQPYGIMLRDACAQVAEIRAALEVPPYYVYNRDGAEGEWFNQPGDEKRIPVGRVAANARTAASEAVAKLGEVLAELTEESTP